MIEQVTFDEVAKYVKENVNEPILQTFLTIPYTFELYAIKENNEIVSFIATKTKYLEYEALPKNVNKVYYLHTKQSCRRKGYANQLLKYVLEKSELPVLYVTNVSTDGSKLFNREPDFITESEYGIDYYYIMNTNDLNGV